ncbi:hypothetical protein Lal_00023814 [Lupinus albus]|uniref:Putative ascorbate ferrireductase (Transmembrane) n=1 Tax=Lupinus albus TaxID=3870 RepID=A0A6A4PHN0_LUPAL|nr:putative ascorbate ferrireductase (transmembrane) [Lupinus albus]KAF1887806.1 hypothetical protein Lal_00023814 [Lupinus albus]
MRSYTTSVLAHLFGILAIILLLVWLLHYREGIEYDSDNPLRVFNVHPLLMFLGFIFFAGQAIMSYHTVPSEWQTQRLIHMTLHLIAIVLGVVGICAVFRFHDMVNLEDVYTLHSWIGIATFCLFGVQWLLGVVFMFRGSRAERAGVAPWHIAGGRALLYMAICAALTGLMERFTMLKPHQTESRLINFLGLAILLFGVFVDITVGLAYFGS